MIEPGAPQTRREKAELWADLIQQLVEERAPDAETAIQELDGWIRETLAAFNAEAPDDADEIAKLAMFMRRALDLFGIKAQMSGDDILIKTRLYQKVCEEVTDQNGALALLNTHVNYMHRHRTEGIRQMVFGTMMAFMVLLKRHGHEVPWGISE